MGGACEGTGSEDPKMQGLYKKDDPRGVLVRAES